MKAIAYADRTKKADRRRSAKCKKRVFSRDRKEEAGLKRPMTNRPSNCFQLFSAQIHSTNRSFIGIQPGANYGLRIERRLGSG